jgi:hypothetical protein
MPKGGTVHKIIEEIRVQLEKTDSIMRVIKIGNFKPKIKINLIYFTRIPDIIFITFPLAIIT